MPPALTLHNCNSQTSNGICSAPGINATGPHTLKNTARKGSSSGNNVTTPIDCKTNPSDPSCPQKQNLPLTTKKCPDGSIIDVSANCPTNMPPPTPPIPSNNPSTNNPGNGPQSPSSNNPSSNSENGGSSSSPSNSGGSGSKHHHQS